LPDKFSIINSDDENSGRSFRTQFRAKKEIINSDVRTASRLEPREKIFAELRIDLTVNPIPRHSLTEALDNPRAHLQRNKSDADSLNTGVPR
jgi:hypothetical protein